MCFSIGLSTCYALCILQGQLYPQDRAKVYRMKKAYNHGSSFKKEENERKEKVGG